MASLSLDIANSPAILRQRAAGRSISWPAVITVLAARTLFFLGAQAVVALVFAMQGRPSPWLAAADWWPADGVLANLLSLALLFFMTRREGIRLGQLVSLDCRRLVHDILLGLALFLLAFPIAFAGMVVVGSLIYGSYTAAPIVGGHLPLWAGLVSVLVFPIINGITEQMTYTGFALPRLEALTGKTAWAVAIVVFWFALQHCALGLTLDVRYVLYRFLSFLPLCAIVPLIYLRQRRLTALIACHWCLDLVGSISLMLVP